MIIKLDFRKIKKNSEKFDSETSKLWPVNLSEKRRNIVSVHQLDG